MSKQSPQPLLNGPANVGLPQYAYHPVSYQTIAVPGRVEEEVRYRRSPLRRFIVAFLVAVGIFAVLKTLVRIHIHGHPHWSHRHGWNLPPNVVLDSCVPASEWAVADAALSGPVTHSSPGAGTTFEIPLTADTVLMLSGYTKRSWLSTGSLGGSLDITTSPRLSDTARVVIASLHGGHKRAAMKACLMSGPDSAAGVGIFARARTFSRRAATAVKIQLVLPEGKTPLRLKGLSVDLPNFSVDVGHLKDAVAFGLAALRTSNSALSIKSLAADDAKLRTSNSAIHADSLTSCTLTVETSNGGISGSYNTSGSLYLSTSNAPINVSVGLAQLDDNRHPTLQMRTSNHRLDAAITLATPGQFRVEGTTSNGVLAIGAVGPADAVLDLTARTSNLRAEVTLPAAYEGAFWLTTSNRPATVERRDEEDGRTFEWLHKDAGRANGWVYADKKNRELGRAHVTTSNAELVLVV